MKLECVLMFMISILMLFVGLYCLGHSFVLAGTAIVILSAAFIVQWIISLIKLFR